MKKIFYITYNKVQIGFSTKHELSKCKMLTETQISAFRKDCKAAVIAFISKILEKSPLKYPVTRFLTFLVALQDLGKTRFDKLLQYLVSSGWISGNLADRATHQYKEICVADS